MITRPSIHELLEGLVRNLESASGTATADGTSVPTTLLLTVLDRLTNEWASWAALLSEDNDDLRQTLAAIGRPFLSDNGPPPATIPADRAAIERLETDNRALKQALVEAIVALDLPVPASAPAEQQAIDRAVVALLLRVLHREARVVVAPPRVAPTSGNPASSSLTPESLTTTLQRFLASEMPDASTIDVSKVQRLSGGASREAWIFDAAWRIGEQQHRAPCILMREPLSSVLTSDSSQHSIDGTRRTVANEVRVVRAMYAAGIPVPEILWADPHGTWLERPFSIARRLPGTADVSALVGTPAQQPLLEQYIDLLARIHALDPTEVGVSFLGQPTAATAALEQVALFERNFEAERLEPFPAATYLVRWLQRNAPVAGRVGVVHGDYRLGNLLHEAGQVLAVLDWEQVHIGDPLEEIAFMYWSLWTLETICPIDEFVRRYEARTGTTIDRQALAYQRMFIELKMLVVLLTGLRSYYATPERQLLYGGAPTVEMTRDCQLRALEEIARGGPTVAFDAYQKRTTTTP